MNIKKEVANPCFTNLLYSASAKNNCVILTRDISIILAPGQRGPGTSRQKADYIMKQGCHGCQLLLMHCFRLIPKQQNVLIPHQNCGRQQLNLVETCGF